ncbi:MAG: adventurous gliding motility lipoprotein CglD [Deltaproteobacteria bacterium]|nr:adventurous gliding motility lipoprotein CglD [Deltaproteobacteria bacterium]
MKKIDFLPLLLVFFILSCSEQAEETSVGDSGGVEDITVQDITPKDSGIRDQGGDETEDVVDMDYTIRDADPKNPDNGKIDSDCDGLSDLEEFSIIYPGGRKTDPMNPDTDGDGIPDGVEAGRIESPDPLCKRYFKGDADPSSVTNPISVDSDCDGIPDGDEDKDRDGKRDEKETDAADPDTDRDGLPDGLEVSKTEPADKEFCKNFIPDADPATSTDPLNADTDGDGINDGQVDRNHNGKADINNPANPDYAGGDETDPANPDSDGDGISDGQEDKNRNFIVDPGETDPLIKNRDTDGDGIDDEKEILCGYDPNDPDMDNDGLKDGVEDRNSDCSVNIGETDPRRLDSDCDGLADGEEDKDKDGKVDSGETDPANPDTDGDGLTDGVESGRVINLDAVNCRDFRADQDPDTRTDPLNPDTDGDGIVDGAEDGNQNGKVDTGELDPRNGSDGSGAAKDACATENLVKINFFDIKDADSIVALADEYRDIAPGEINLSKLLLNGNEEGFLFVHKDKNVGGFLIEKVSEGSDVMAEEKIIRGDTPCKVPSGYLEKIDCLSNPVVQRFTTWDGYEALSASYDYGKGEEDDLKGRLNLIAKAFLGDKVSGLFADGIEKNGNHKEGWKLQIEIIRRKNNKTIVVGSLVSEGVYKNDPLAEILRGDITNGSAIAQRGDTTGVQCDIRISGNPMVDFIWVVDDSCSMSPYQKAVNVAATAFVDKLKNSQVDYRIAAITTGYWQKTLKGSNTLTKNFEKVFGFTKDLDEFKTWFKQPCELTDLSCIGDEQCTGTEKGVESLYDAMLNPKNNAIPLLPTPNKGEPVDPKKIRYGAKVVVIFLSDAGDQSNREGEYVNGNPPSDANDGPWWDNNLPAWPAIFDEISRRKDIDGLIANAIICSTNDCGGETKNPSLYDIIVQQTNGVQGLIKDDASINTTMQAIVDSAIAATGISLSKSPISASIKVVQEDPPPKCPQPTPRSPVNGFDYDGIFQRISFFGDCRPEKPAKKIAVSYRYWIDRDRPLKDCGECKEPFVCNTETGRCECPPDCDGKKPGKNFVCNQNNCTWVCPSECGGACSLYYVCRSDDCTCTCDENFSCNIGYRPDPENCVCRCSAEELKCDESHEADLEKCQCICKKDCGGCPDGFICQPSLCYCERKPL